MELETFLRILVQKWRMIVPILIVTFLATAIFTATQPPIYEAKATYVATLSRRVRDNRDFAAVINILSSRIEISTTYAEVANSRRIKAIAGQKLNLSPQALRDLSVSSRLIPGTNIVEVAVQGTNPARVRDFANAVGVSTIEYVQSLYSSFTLDLLDDATAPRAPIRPNVALNLILGGVLGLVLGVGIALLTYFFQSSYKEPKKIPDTEPMLQVASADDLSILHLRQDLLTLREQFELTRQTLDQMQAALRQTNSYAKEIRSTVYDLEKHSNGNHTVGEGLEREK